MIEWLGHAAFKITGREVVIYIDPYEIRSKDEADIVLITHDHFDHASPKDIRKIAAPKTSIVGPKKAKVELAGLPGTFHEIAPGEEIEIAGVSIRAVPAYNIGKSYHPRSAGYVGYIVGVDGKSIYHAGDTDLIPEMEGLGVDVALLPVGGTYTMDAREAAEAFRRIGAKEGIPMHCGTIVGSERDAEAFRRLIGP